MKMSCSTFFRRQQCSSRQVMLIDILVDFFSFVELLRQQATRKICSHYKSLEKLPKCSCECFFKADIFVNLLLSYSINAAKITKLRKWHAISQSLNKTNLKIFQLSIICKGRQSSYYLFRIYFMPWTKLKIKQHRPNLQITKVLTSHF